MQCTREASFAQRGLRSGLGGIDPVHPVFGLWGQWLSLVVLHHPLFHRIDISFILGPYFLEGRLILLFLGASGRPVLLQPAGPRRPDLWTASGRVWVVRPRRDPSRFFFVFFLCESRLLGI